MINRVSKSSAISSETLFNYDDQDVRFRLRSNLAFNWIDVVCLDSLSQPVTPTSGEFKVFVKSNDLTGYEDVTGPIPAKKCGGSSMQDGEQQGAFHGSFALSIKIVPIDISANVASYIVYVRQSDFGKTPEIPVKTYDQAISSGEIGGSTGFFSFGRNPDIDSGNEEFFNDFSPNFEFAQSAEPVYISSSNPSDTATLTIGILDQDYNLHIIEQAVNGQTKTQIPNIDALRVNFFINNSSSRHQGDIYLYFDSAVSGGIPQDQAKILAKSSEAAQQSNSAIYTVPAGKIGLLRDIIVTGNRSSNSGSADIFLYTKKANGVARRRAEVGLQNSGDSSLFFDFPIPLRLDAGEDVYLTALPTANSYDLSGGFQLQVEDA